MNQTCRVCGEPAAGFHFGAFTCEGCKSFFGRSYNNLSSITECKNNGKCVIDKKNRTTCKACRLRKCYTVGMSKGGSRYGRRSNWFKIHCLLQEHQQQALEAAGKAAAAVAAGGGLSPDSLHAASGDFSSNLELKYHQQQQQQHHHHQQQQQQQAQQNIYHHHHHQQQHHQQQQQQQQRNNAAAAQLAAAHGFLGAYPGYTHPHSHPLQHTAHLAGSLPLDMLGQSNPVSPFMSAAAAAAAAAAATAAARHPGAAAAEAAAFFSMMSSPQSAFQLPPHLLLPAAAAAAAGYHPNSAAAAAVAAADAAYRNDMYGHRQSVDSVASTDSQRFTVGTAERKHSTASSSVPYASASGSTSVSSSASTSASPTPSLAHSTTSVKPEHCVPANDDESQQPPQQQQQKSSKTSSQSSSPKTKIHSPIPVRATPLNLNSNSTTFVNTNSSSNIKPETYSPIPVTSIVPTPTPTPTGGSQPRTPEPHAGVNTLIHQSNAFSQTHLQQYQPHHNHQHQTQQTPPNAEQTALAFAAKMQSLSPVSVCSITAETQTTQAQDSPMDLSMKVIATKRTLTVTDESVAQDQSNGIRRKFYQMHSSESEASSESSTDALATEYAQQQDQQQQQEQQQQEQQQHEEEEEDDIDVTNNNNNNKVEDMSAQNSHISLANESTKRQKMNDAVEATTTPISTNYNNYNATAHSATSLHGIFVCV